MICYKDRQYCMSTNCRNYETCRESVKAAMEEKAKSGDEFIRNLPIDMAEWADCPNFKLQTDDHHGD